MNEFYKQHRDAILFVWGVCMMTFIIITHAVADLEAYLVLAAAIGLPLYIQSRSKNGLS